MHAAPAHTGGRRATCAPRSPRASGLAVPNLGTYVSCLDPDAVDPALGGAATVGAPSIRVQVPNYDGRDPYLPLRDAALGAFDDVTGLAARHGVRALVEIHMGTIVPSASRRLSSAAGSIHATWA